jgi:glycosyltransferase involved in cell wall biosynthesis
MKLCVVTHNVLKGDGQGRVNYEVVWEALRQGHHITLVSSSVSEDLQAHPNIRWIRISVQAVPTDLGTGIVFCWKSTAWLRRHSHEFDSVLVNGGLTDAPSDINAVHFVHTAWLRSQFHAWQKKKDLYGLYQWIYSQYHAYREIRAFERSRLIVAVSEKVKQELIQIGVSEAQIHVVLNGVDLQEFHPGQVDRDKWNLPLTAKIALFVGEIRSNRKNLDTVLSAIKATPNLHLAVVGDTTDSLYPALAQKLEISDRVHFLGYRKDVAEIMQAVDFFVFPSRYEACTLALMEALASGLPVVTAISTGGAEVITPDCGFVLDNSEDWQTLRSHLETLSHNQNHHMRQAARDIAENYSWQTTAQRYLDLFERNLTDKLPSADNSLEYAHKSPDCCG